MALSLYTWATCMAMALVRTCESLEVGMLARTAGVVAELSTAYWQHYTTASSSGILLALVLLLLSPKGALLLLLAGCCAPTSRA